jgi:hypothetical protein
MQKLQVGDSLTCLQWLTLNTYKQVLTIFKVISIIGLQPILGMQLRSINICILSNS